LPAKAYNDLVLSGRGLFGPWVILSDPAGVRRVLVENAANYPKTDFDLRFFSALFGGGLLGSGGEVWRRHRRIMAPAFDPRSVAAYGPAMERATAEFLTQWKALGDGATVDMAEEMRRLTLRVITGAVFSVDSDEIMDLVSGALSRGLHHAARANVLDLIPGLSELRMRAREKRLARESTPLDQAVAKLIADREANLANAPPDLLTRLVQARDDGGGAGLTAKEIRDEIVTIFMAGHETTAGALSWTWYLLAQRPDAAARMHAELDTMLTGKTPAYGDLSRLTFTRQIIEESLRLYPTAPGLSTRRALAKDVVSGREIPKGARVHMFPWVLHRHRQLWQNPEAFDPTRFSADRSTDRPRFAYLPFGAGPRVCIGQVLALNEVILILASLAQHFEPRLASDAKVVAKANITLQFGEGLRMTLNRRASHPSPQGTNP